MEQELYIKEINKQVIGIKIVRDTIMIDYNNEFYNIDSVIVFVFGMMKFVISQTSFYTYV